MDQRIVATNVKYRLQTNLRVVAQNWTITTVALYPLKSRPCRSVGSFTNSHSIIISNGLLIWLHTTSVRGVCSPLCQSQPAVRLVLVHNYREIT